MSVFVWYFCLILARVATFVATVPLLGGTSLPRTVKAGLALALTVLWFVPIATAPAAGQLAASLELPWWGLFLALGREICIGTVLGYGLGLFLVPVHIAGEFMTQEMGLSFGNQVSGVNGSSSPLTQILELLATALFFSVDGHHLLLGLLHDTFVTYPLGGASLPGAPLPGLVEGAMIAEEWGLTLAMPVSFCLFLTTIVLAFLNRAVPQMNLYSLGFSLRLGAGLGACLLFLPMWTSAVLNGFGQFRELVLHMM